ncbi:hypothetical protein [Nocardia caishijiensis]|uniref:Tetratricopeptide repeat protein n=1 Tax=Nocardia caishijiensis TaxID=184756 RepID=A0ABQ6YM15_9NOCA|nr:hypothetical protein [Nocardia caishijiensis]KAF0846559.1 hypothetical protein FNL39_105475 [Nocardia caishijiensis]
MDHALVESALAGLSAANSRELERECEQFALRYLAQQVEPQFDLDSADFDRDPLLICADRYWNQRFQAEPTLRTAVLCAGWMSEHIADEVYEPIRQKWALGFAFITRDTVESADEIADATADVVGADDSTCNKAYFAALYHAGKLRANFFFAELEQFLAASPLAIAAGPHRNSVLFTALRAFAAFGSRTTAHQHACELLDQVWDSPQRSFAAVDVVLNGLASGVDFDGRGALLRDRAAEAVAAYPGRDILHFRLATGRWLCGEHDAAMSDIDEAIRLLPAKGWRVSHELLQSQYLARRDAIEAARVIDRQARADRTRVEHTEQEVGRLAGEVRGTVLRAVELVTIFAAVVAFAVGSLNVSLNGNLSRADRIWIVATQGLGLLLFAFLILGGSWFIADRLTRRSR